MTKFEFYSAIIAKSVITDEMVEIAQAGLESLAKKKASDSKRNAEKKMADAPIIQAMIEFLTGKEKVLASDIAKACDISTSKVIALCKEIPNLTCEKVKIKGVGERNAYTLVEQCNHRPPHKSGGFLLRINLDVTRLRQWVC